MTEQELQAAEALANAATPEPWEWLEDDDEMHGSTGVVCSCEFGQHAGAAIIKTDGGTYGPCLADREFIAAARTLVPKLTKEVRRLQALVERSWNEATDTFHITVNASDAAWERSAARKALDGAV